MSVGASAAVSVSASVRAGASPVVRTRVSMRVSHPILVRSNALRWESN